MMPKICDVNRCYGESIQQPHADVQNACKRALTARSTEPKVQSMGPHMRRTNCQMQIMELNMQCREAKMQCIKTDAV